MSFERDPRSGTRQREHRNAFRPNKELRRNAAGLALRLAGGDDKRCTSGQVTEAARRKNGRLSGQTTHRARFEIYISLLCFSEAGDSALETGQS
jgi:hypothetical protein